MRKKTNWFIFVTIMPGKKSEQTRQFIIEKAAALFNTKGYHGTSMADIMAATGLTKGGIYGNFKIDSQDKKGVKEEIALAAFEYAVQEVNHHVRRRTGVIDHSLDKLKAVVYFYKERILNPPIEGGCPILNSSTEADDNLPVLRDRVLEELRTWHSKIVYTLHKGIERGEVRSDVAADDFATLFIGSLEGGIMMARIYKDVKPFEIMARQLTQQIDNLRR